MNTQPYHTLYCARWGGIEEVRASRITDSSVWLLGQKNRRQRQSPDEGYFETLREALEFLLAKQRRISITFQERIESANAGMEVAKANIAKLEAQLTSGRAKYTPYAKPPVNVELQ